VLSGDLFLLVSRDRKRTKVLYYDGSGLCWFAKRLDRGHFVAVWKRHARPRGLVMTLSELALFIEGSDAVRTSLSPPLIRKTGSNFRPRKRKAARRERGRRSPLEIDSGPVAIAERATQLTACGLAQGSTTRSLRCNASGTSTEAKCATYLDVGMNKPGRRPKHC
jgi:IS66 Orf2 like protein